MPEYLTTAEAAALLGVSRNTARRIFYALERRGVLLRLNPRGKMRAPLATLKKIYRRSFA